MNNPFTAITSLDWLGAALCEGAQRELPSPFRVDDAGRVRVIADPLTFDAFVRRAFGQFRQYLATDKNACLHALATIEAVSTACRRREQVRTLLEEVHLLASAASEGLDATLYTPVEAASASLKEKLAKLMTGVA